jgi:peptide/nickel transport system ATP-binding protein
MAASGMTIEKAPVLEFRISARYGAREVLREVTGHIAANEIVALVGLSGSGKSTLALSLLRLLRYRGGEVSGSIVLEGSELIAKNDREMRAVLGKRIGYVPQSPASALNDRLRVETLLEETWRAHSPDPAPGGFFTKLLESVQLPQQGRDFLRQRAGQLSTGQGQRLLIALAIMHKPALLIADEPISALDAITQASVLKLFQQLNQREGTAILFISHDLLSIASISHRVEILNEGRIVESGPPDEIFHAPKHEFTRRLVDAMPRLSSLATPPKIADNV